MYNATAGLTGGKPMVTAAFTYSNMHAVTNQAAEDTVSPKIGKLAILFVMNHHLAFTVLGSRVRSHR